MADDTQQALLTLTADVVAAHLGNNTVSLGDVGPLIERVHAALAGLGAPIDPPVEEQKPAVSVRSSVKPAYITCLEDGRKFKMLKRHLARDHGLTTDQYRAKWKLPADYPMVASDYAEKRRALAVKIGLGRKPIKARPPSKPARKPRK